eukprot:g20757.t1
MWRNKDMPGDASRIAQLEFELRLEKHQNAALLMQKDKALFHLNSRDERIAELEGHAKSKDGRIAELEDHAKSKDEDLHQLREVNEAYWDRIGDLESRRLALEDEVEDKDKQIAELQQRVRPQIPPVVVFRRRRGVKKDELVVKLEPSDVYDPQAHHEFLIKDVSGKEKGLVMVTCSREECESLEGSIVNVNEGQLDCLVKTARDTLEKDKK